MAFLPPEIASLVAKHLPSRNDLRNLRFLNRIFNEAVRKELFRVVYLKVNFRSFERMSSISKDESLRQIVEVVEYDGIQMAFPRWFRSGTPCFAKWLLHVAGTGLCLSRRQRETFLDRFDDEELQTACNNYCEYLIGQEKLLWGSNNVLHSDDMPDHILGLLHKAFLRFPRLSVVNCTYQIRHNVGRRPELQPISNFGPIARELLSGPTEHKHRMKHFGRLLRAVSGLRQIEALTFNADFDEFRKLKDCLPGLDLQGIQHLGLKSLGSEYTDPVLARLLELASGAKSLHLSFVSGVEDVDRLNIENYHKTEFFENNSLLWANLESLSLQAVVITVPNFHSLMSRHSSTLRSLKLSSIALLRGPSVDRASWITIITKLSELRSLQKVEFHGRFSTDSNEAWTTCSPGSTKSGSPVEECLMDRVERFIVHGGQSPFTQRKPELRAEDDHLLGAGGVPKWTPHYAYTWQEDRSWRFDWKELDGTRGALTYSASYQTAPKTPFLSLVMN